MSTPLPPSPPLPPWQPVNNLNQPCWGRSCGRDSLRYQARCNFCGSGGACCRQTSLPNWPNSPAECGFGALGGTDGHICVLAAVSTSPSPPSPPPAANLNHHCWGSFCGRHGLAQDAFCNFCGTAGACCRQTSPGWPHSPAECGFGALGGTDSHICVVAHVSTSPSPPSPPPVSNLNQVCWGTPVGAPCGGSGILRARAICNFCGTHGACCRQTGPGWPSADSAGRVLPAECGFGALGGTDIHRCVAAAGVVPMPPAPPSPPLPPPSPPPPPPLPPLPPPPSPSPPPSPWPPPTANALGSSALSNEDGLNSDNTTTIIMVGGACPLSKRTPHQTLSRDRLCVRDKQVPPPPRSWGSSSP